MKTDTLIDLLTRDAGPAPRALAARRLSPAAGAGLAAATVDGPTPALYVGGAGQGLWP